MPQGAVKMPIWEGTRTPGVLDTPETSKMQQKKYKIGIGRARTVKNQMRGDSLTTINHLG